MGAPEEVIRSRPDAGRRNLLVVRAGDESLHERWLAGSSPRDFDLLVSYYGADAGRFREDADLYQAMVGTRWPAHAAIFTTGATLHEAYDSICFACDDLDADAATWNRLFRLCRDCDLDLAQPAILGPISYAITAPVDGLLYRLTTFVENMCPVFSRRAFDICRPTFGESVSGWGLARVWPKLLAAAHGRLGIVDDVRVTHTRAVKEGSLYKLIDSLGIDPLVERDSVMARYGIEDFEIRELARVPLPAPAGGA